MFNNENDSIKPMNLPFFLTLLQPIDFSHKLGICERLFGKAIAPLGVCLVKTGAGLVWKLDLANPTHRWIVYGKYEGASFLNWAKNYLPANGVVIDSGASIGQMLMYLAQWIPQGKLLAFEPGREAREWLTQCLQIHSHLPVELCPYGLGSAANQLRLHHIGENYQHGAQSQISETEGEEINIVRLDEQLAQRHLTTVDLWCLDVEGYEIPALQGAETLLKEQRIKALYVELSGANSQKIRDYLSQFGYICYLFQSNGKYTLPSQFPEHTNGLFLPQ